MCIILRSGTLLVVMVTRRRRTIRITFSSRPFVCVRVCVSCTTALFFLPTPQRQSKRSAAPGRSENPCATFGTRARFLLDNSLSLTIFGSCGKGCGGGVVEVLRQEGLFRIFICVFEFCFGLLRHDRAYTYI